jgi:hypothetical protein
LISDAIDRSIDQFEFRILAGQSVYFDHQYLSGTVDKDYIISSLRQKLLASGCTLKDDRYDARFVVEARSGAVGTDQHDVTVGVPSVNIPPILGGVAGIPSSIPEIPLVKKTAQKGVAKLAVFAYERETGQAVWQSGAAPANSTAQHTWIFGAGPIQRGTIYKGTKFAGDQLVVPTLPGADGSEDEDSHLSITTRAIFDRPRSNDREVQLAGHEESSEDRPANPPEQTPAPSQNAPPSEPQ